MYYSYVTVTTGTWRAGARSRWPRPADGRDPGRPPATSHVLVVTDRIMVGYYAVVPAECRHHHDMTAAYLQVHDSRWH